MLRITDQYFWNFVFSIVFIAFVVFAAIVLDGRQYLAPSDLTITDIALLSLATFRLIRLFVYDAVTRFFREQFWDAKRGKGGIVLEKPPHGPRRTIADLLSCPWCFGVWAGAVLTFIYLLSPIAFYPVLMLAISAVATFLQLTANLIGWKAEQAKRDAS